MEQVIGYAPYAVGVITLIAMAVAYKYVLQVFGIVLIGETELGIVNKKFVLVGKNSKLPDGSIVALNGEAGLQASTLAPGVHFGYWPWQFEITRQAFTTIPDGKIGVVEARDGIALPKGRVLAKHVDCDSFQNAAKFLTGGGERGSQLTIIPPGTYRINTKVFNIRPADAIEVKENKVGIVTTKEGASLRTGDIAGKEIQNHNMFQNAQAFLDNGGSKGLQEQVILAGRYYLNPLFVTVEQRDMFVVPIAQVGVVISYVGEDGQDVTGVDFQHGNLVNRGQKGVWAEPLDPGKYPINPYTHSTELVPTANVVLNWADSKNESHKLDANLSTITARSSDGFTFSLDVSQIIHVPRSEAPKVIARFGNMPNLVTQVLEPTIGNYFRNAAQAYDAINFLTSRAERQKEARDCIANALTGYNIVAVDTLIGDIVPPPALMQTLTDRKIATQQKATYATQEEAENSRAKLEQAKAMASTQASVVDSERRVSIADFDAKSAVKQAEGVSLAKTINAKADAEVLKVVGDAEAGKVRAIGEAEAEVTKKKIDSMEAGNYAGIEIAKALSKSGFKLTPDVVVGGGEGKGGSLIDVLLARMISADNGNGKAVDTKH